MRRQAQGLRSKKVFVRSFEVGSEYLFFASFCHKRKWGSRGQSPSRFERQAEQILKEKSKKNIKIPKNFLYSLALHKRRNPKPSTILTIITKTPLGGVLHLSTT